MAVERIQGGLKIHRNAQRVQGGGLGAALAGHALADVLPQIAELGRVGAGDVVGHRHPWQLDDAALNGVHQREVAHCPRKQRALPIAGAAQEERRGRQIDYPAQAEPALHHLQAGYPYPRRFAVLPGLLAVVSGELALGALLLRLLAVAVMGLVVERHHVLHAHQARHHPLQHLALGLERVQLRAAALQQRAPALREILRLPPHEGVEVGDNDICAVQVAEQVARHQFAAFVVAVRVVGLQHPQAVANGQAGGQHQEAAREPPAVRMPHRVDGLPRDQHRHHRGLAGAGGELQCQPGEPRIGLFVGRLQPLQELPSLASRTGRDLGQPDHRLYRFDLAEERAQAAEPVVPPVVQQPGGLRGNPPLGARQPAPIVHALAHALDQPHQLVLLAILVRLPPGIIDTQLRLLGALLASVRDRGDERHRAPSIHDAVGGLPVLIQLPVPRRVLVRRIQDRLFEEPLHHAILPKTETRVRLAGRAPRVGLTPMAHLGHGL